MPLLEITKGLLDVSKSLYEVGEKLQAQENDARERTAQVLDAIVVCLEKVVELAGTGNVPALAGPCEELGIYLENFASLDHLPDLVGTGRIQLLNKLTEAVKARRDLVLSMSVTTSDPNGYDKSYDQLQRALGMFRATSTLIRGIPGAKKQTKSVWQRVSIGALIVLGGGTLGFHFWPAPLCESVAGSWIREHDRLTVDLSQSGCDVSGFVTSDSGTDSHEIGVRMSGRQGQGHVRRVYHGCTTTLATSYDLISEDRLRIEATGNGCDLSDYHEDYTYRRMK